MNRFWKCLALLFILAIPLWYGPVIYTDLTSPELWSDWLHDPRWYAPPLLLVVVAEIAIYVTAARWQRRWDGMTPEERAREARRILKGR